MSRKQKKNYIGIWDWINEIILINLLVESKNFQTK